MVRCSSISRVKIMNQQDIEQVVKAVLLKMKDSSQPAGTVHDMGVFASLDDAVAAATVAQQGLKRVAMRQQVIQAIREAGESMPVNWRSLR